MHSPDHSTKGTPSALAPAPGEWPLTAGEYVVSGSISSPLRGAFHLSLTVLVRYRSLKVFCLGGWSPLLPTNSPGFVVLRHLTRSGAPARYGTLTLSRAAFQRLRVCAGSCVCQALQPPLLRKARGLGIFPPRSPLLRESRLMSSRRATEMFQFARGPPLGLWIQPRVSRHDSGWVAPFGSSGLLARMQLPLNVSPVSASFFGLQRRGIHLVLSRACLFMRACASRPHDRSRTCAPSFPLFSLSSCLFSALGKIEEIILHHISAMQL